MNIMMSNIIQRRSTQFLGAYTAILVLCVLLMISTSNAQDTAVQAERFAEELDDRHTTDELGEESTTLWSSFVNLCDIIAPFCGVICFLAPLPTINEIVRNKTVGALPLLPYSSMVANSFVWVMYGLLKNLPSVYGSNAIGVLLGVYYLKSFIDYCGPMANNLPGTISLHIKGVGAIILLNTALALSGIANASEIIGKEGVLYCIVLFASPLVALQNVIATKSAASIPLPFTLACLLNCLAWTVVGLWKITPSDFNIYFPNIMGLCCAVAQLVLKGIYGSRPSAKELPK